MDLPGRLRGGRACSDGPGADLLRAGGEEAGEAGHIVAGADETVQARFFEASSARYCTRSSSFSTSSSASRRAASSTASARSWSFSMAAHRVATWALSSASPQGFRFRDAGHVQRRFRREQRVAAQEALLFRALRFDQARRRPLRQDVAQPAQQSVLQLRLTVAAVRHTSHPLQAAPTDWRSDNPRRPTRAFSLSAAPGKGHRSPEDRRNTTPRRRPG